MKIKKNLVLLGMMGVGKTRIGKYVAKKLKLIFLTLIKPLTKIFIFIAVIMVIIFIVGNLELPTPSKIIKQEIPNEKLEIVK